MKLRNRRVARKRSNHVLLDEESVLFNSWPYFLLCHDPGSAFVEATLFRLYIADRTFAHGILAHEFFDSVVGNLSRTSKTDWALWKVRLPDVLDLLCEHVGHICDLEDDAREDMRRIVATLAEDLDGYIKFQKRKAAK